MKRRRAFTLVELMVAIALVVILMLGVSRVFSTASQTISVNQSISNQQRDSRAAQAVFQDDFGHILTIDAPFIVISSSVQPAFRNRADDLGDLHTTLYPSTATTNGHPLTQDIDGNNSEADVIDRIPTTTINNRNHRVDVISFFVRGLYRRQTGNDGVFMESMTRTEAMVKYGHVRKYIGTGSLSVATNYTDPGVGTFARALATPAAPWNPNNLYASDFALARNVMLLSEGTTNDVNGYATSIVNNGVNQHFAQRTPAQSANRANLSPLALGSQTDTNEVVQESRYDIAGITLAQMRSLMIDYVINARTTPLPAGYTATWGRSLFSYRFWCNPQINKPITSNDAARFSPIFLQGCSSFTVEFAGDFLTQNIDQTSPNYGDVIDTYYNTVTGTKQTTDGKIDFVVIPSPVPGGQPSTAPRWYGLPRDTNGDGIILGNVAPNTPAQLRASTDVVPLRDYWQLVPREVAACAPFEEAMSVAAGGFTKKPNYAATTAANGNSGMALGAQYVCGFGPNDPKPRMIRITYTLDDPTGRTGEGQVFSQVFELP